MSYFQEIPVSELPAWWGRHIGESSPARLQPAEHDDLFNWNMELHDSRILEWIYRRFQPVRHLEFGTWKGFGARLCLQSCGATVWTINLWEGETKEDGSWAYGETYEKPPVSLETVMLERTSDHGESPVQYRTDALGLIGVQYREAGLSHRVCQIYCDSTLWDTSAYPSDFFDTVLIDGGHTPEIVVSDTRKALQVTRPGALFFWHDFCPVPEVRTQFSTPAGVFDGLSSIAEELKEQFSQLIWIQPSWILLGIRR